jgi:hypothetical protein
MIYDTRNGLKGQSNLVQGNPESFRDALGWKSNIKIAHAITLLEVLQLFRTKNQTKWVQACSLYPSS